MIYPVTHSMDPHALDFGVTEGEDWESKRVPNMALNFKSLEGV